MTTKWNPYFVAYAKAHGRTPEAQSAADDGAYRGGCMSGYMDWISRRKAAFVKYHPEACFLNEWGRLVGIVDHAAWGRFLEESAVAALEAVETKVE